MGGNGKRCEQEEEHKDGGAGGGGSGEVNHWSAFFLAFFSAGMVEADGIVARSGVVLERRNVRR